MTNALDLDAYELITFDCYGTLVDWERGIVASLNPMLAAHGVALEPADLLAAYGRIEPAIQAPGALPYAEVLRRVVDAFGAAHGFVPTDHDREALVAGWPDLLPFPDTGSALRRLSEGRRLVILSNVDRALFAATRRRLEVGFRFADVVAAGDVGAYKPDVRMFEAARARCRPQPGRWLHVAQSLFHDVAPARALGIPTVHVDRPPLAGGGAVPPSDTRPDWTVPDLATLAASVGGAGPRG